MDEQALRYLKRCLNFGFLRDFRDKKLGPLRYRERFQLPYLVSKAVAQSFF